MIEYTVITEDEKAEVRKAAIRNLEHQLYQLDLELTAENAKEVPTADAVEYFNSAIAEKQAQIAAIE
jgi:hypothetical protein